MASVERTLTRIGLPTDLGGVFVNVVLRLLIVLFTVDPWWFESLYLSIFFVDMAGNSADLYNKHPWFDHVSHSFGPGALAVVLMGAFALGPLAAAGFSTMLHTQLEIQEIYGDQFLGTHNVRDIMDTANDMLFGIVGATVFVLVYKGTEWYQLRRAQPKRVRRRRS